MSMGMAVCGGASLICDCGLTPSTLVVIRPRNFSGIGMAANIRDHWPLVNIWPFGLCRSLGNPAVAAATALTGVLTPMPCRPSTLLPWSFRRPKILLAGQIALDSQSQLLCSYGGVIRVMYPGQRREIFL
jgi:hypothetical protein